MSVSVWRWSPLPLARRKELLAEPEGTQRELIANGMLRAGQTITLDAHVPACSVPGSEKLLLAITPSLVAQSINGIDDLLQMPYGCGEQNMIFFAPDVEILRYLDATGQLTPEVRAKAEHFIICGYQRELTYRRQDGSFSAFGDSDESGSLWLTAFVLGTFSGARDVQTIDESVLAGEPITAGFPVCIVDFRCLAEFATKWLQYDSGSANLIDFDDLRELLESWLSNCPE